MAETYTKPFESVQAAINLFEQKIDRKWLSTGSNYEEKEEKFSKESMNGRQRHKKDLAFLEFIASPKSHEELLAKLSLYKAERVKYKEKFRKAQSILLEFEKGLHLLHSVDSLKVEKELKKTELSSDKEKKHEFMTNFSEIKKVNLSSQLLDLEEETQPSLFIAGMEEDLQVSETEFFQLQIQFEVFRRKLNEMEDLEKELLRQMIISEYFHMALKQLKEALVFTSEAVLSTKNDLNLVESENERMKQENFENANYAHEIEEEGERMKGKLNISPMKINGMNLEIAMRVDEIQRVPVEMPDSKKKEFELRLQNLDAQVKSNQARQALTEGNDNTKTEARKLTEHDRPTAENEVFPSNKESAFFNADSNGFCAGITISMEEYEFLIQKSVVADNRRSEPADEQEVSKLRGELEDKNAEISGLKCELEKAARRAKHAENAKLVVENQLRTWREQQRLRRAASNLVKEYSINELGAKNRNEKSSLSKLSCIKPEAQDIPSHPKKSTSMHEGRQRKYVPLGKLLKIKL